MIRLKESQIGCMQYKEHTGSNGYQMWIKYHLVIEKERTSLASQANVQKCEWYLEQ